MKDITNMTLDEMLDAGISAEKIYDAIKEKVSTREKENAAAKAREEEITAARRQYKKAHARYVKAITGTEMTTEEMEHFEQEVLIPMEKAWDEQYAPKKSSAANKRKVIVNGAEVASEEDFIRAIMKAIGEI